MAFLHTQRNICFIIGACVISGFFALFAWRFWTYGIEALGINVMIFWFLIIGYFLFVRWDFISRKTLWWLVPLSVIVLSLGIYTTPFTTWISIVLLPCIFFIFTTHESHTSLRALLWSKFIPITLIVCGARFVQSIFIAPGKRNALSMPPRAHTQHKTIHSDATRQIIFGIVILLVISLTIVIPLLSAADASFGRIFTDFFDFLMHITKYFTLSTLFRVLFVLVGTIVLIGSADYWQRVLAPFLTLKKSSSEGSLHKNAITIGIVLGGILALYVLFIAIQIKALFISTLPLDFVQTESLVKTGFWQLFLLTVLNIVFYVGVYGKSTKNVQRILMVFTCASLLLIVSAAYRVFLYVATYGLSYEKFFALYTVIFCSMVFVWFLSLFARSNTPVHIIRTLSFLALGMYAFTTIMPLEYIIFTTNLHLTQKSDSRVDINELQMLYFDALPVVEKNFDVLLVEARKDFIQHDQSEPMILEAHNRIEQEYVYENVDERWLKWVEEKQDKQKQLFTSYFRYDYQKSSIDKGIGEKKKWYEKTLKELIYKSLIDVDNQKYHMTSTQDRTWINVMHGFFVRYQKDLQIYAPDAFNISNLANHDYKLTISTQYDGIRDDSIFIEFFHSAEPRPSQEHIAYTELAEKSKNQKAHALRLSQLNDVPVYTISADTQKNNGLKKYYKMLINTSQGVLVISSNTSHAAVDMLPSMTSKQYIALITPHEELAAVINSLELIDVK